MWFKSIQISHRKQQYLVLISFKGENEETDKPEVEIRSMVNEWILFQNVTFMTRDEAYDFIKHYPPAMAKSFLIREGYHNNAF